MNDNNVPALKTDSMEGRVDKFIKSVDSMENLVEEETLTAIEELLKMKTVKNWGRLIRLVFSEMKAQMSEKIEKVNTVRSVVNK